MNRRAAASVNAIKKALPFEPPGALLLFIIFGSQVRNTQTSESDLDILYVTRTESKQFNEALHNTMVGARGGVNNATVFAHTPRTIKRNANLYGMPEYGALRGHRKGESIILYRSDDACDTLDLVMAGGVGGCRGDEDGHNKKDVCDTAWCARRWLDMSEKLISDGRSYAGKHCHGANDGDHARSVCFMMQRSIDHAIRARLLHHNILFPFTRDIRALHGMLPPESRMPLDFDALLHWGDHPNGRAGRTLNRHAPPCDYISHGVDAAIDAALRAHALVSEALASHPTTTPRQAGGQPHASDCNDDGSAPAMPIIFNRPPPAAAARPRPDRRAE